jgi:AcrR family transcriptional regulator
MTSRQSPRRARTRPTREETRSRLLSAAGEVFSRQGYERATLADVAAAAGLTKGAVYSNFASKEELFFELMNERVSERIEMVKEAAAKTTDLSGLLADVGGGLGELVATQRDWQVLFIEFWLFAVRNPELRTDFVEHRRRIRELIADTIQRTASSAGIKLSAPADDLAVAVLGLSNGVALEQIADPGTAADALRNSLALLIRGAEAPADPTEARPPEPDQAPAPANAASVSAHSANSSG